MREREIDQVQEVIGPEAMGYLLAKLGGSRIVVPKTIGEHHPIAHAVGLEAAQKLSEALPGLTLDLPITARKRALILDALANKVPAHKIARDCLCTVRFVFKVQAENRSQSEPKQMGLL